MRLRVRCRCGGPRVHGDAVRAGRREIIDVTFGLDNHQVANQKGSGHLVQVLDHHWPDRDVGHEAAVHDIDMDPLGPGGNHGVDLLAQAGEVG